MVEIWSISHVECFFESTVFKLFIIREVMGQNKAKGKDDI